ncbi:MAG: DUF1513 domain-containing protein [Roseivivax sp.]|nr:DUF1513 domain-containing protein [Roseivivax sp.]
MTTRRAFLAGLAAAGATPRLGWAAVGQPAYLAAARRADGGFVLTGIDAQGRDAFTVPLPARGHAGAAHPGHAEAVVFARRPGSYALVIDCASGAVLHRLSPPKGRQFNGHGAYSADGALLFTSEQVAEGSAGRIGVWDVAAGYLRTGEVSTHGIGPHELRLMPGGDALVVANGGIDTAPDDRTKLNLHAMSPSLVYLRLDGSLLEQVALEPGLAQNSIRHLAVSPDGQVAFAMQWEGARGMALPLLGLHRRGAAPVLASAPLGDELAMQGYAGSVALSGDGTEFVISSPRGGRLHRFGRDGAFLGAVSRADVCGLAPHPQGVLASDGLGGLLLLRGGATEVLAAAPLGWDNHVVALAG